MRPPPAQSAEAFGGSVLGDTDYLSILMPETGTISYEMHMKTAGGEGKGGSGPPPPLHPLLW